MKPKGHSLRGKISARTLAKLIKKEDTSYQNQKWKRNITTTDGKRILKQLYVNKDNLEEMDDFL